MKLSVVIPIHNAAPYLRACLDSVLNQSLTELEVICVDDASTDESAAIAEEYCAEDSRVRLIRNSCTMFAGPCRNTGLMAAQGEYIHFLDSDDLVEEGAYDRYYSIASETGADLVKGRSSCFDNGTGEITTTALLDLSQVPEALFGTVTSFDANPEVFSHISVVPWNGIYKRSFLLENNIRFNPLICVNDRSFFNEAALLAEKILITRELLVKYRINNGQSLVGSRARNFQCQFQSFEIIKTQCEKYGVSGRNLQVILERELVDLFIWYRKYYRIPEVRESIVSRTQAFAQELDITPLMDCPPNFKWYYDYLRLTEPEVLIAAVHLEGDAQALTACLESIRSQTVSHFAVYGISADGKGKDIFQSFADGDERYKSVLASLDAVPRTAPYLFETYPKEFKPGEFKNHLKKLMAAAPDLRPCEKLLYRPSAPQKKSFLRKALSRCKKMLHGK